MNQIASSTEPTRSAVSRASVADEISRIDCFVRYALAFEEVLVTDDWSPLHAFFTPDAVREVLGGGPLAECSVGREAVVRDLRQGVEALERRFDRRLPEILSGPTERDGVVWIDWRLTCQRHGLPDLVVDGTHATQFDGERICRIDEAVSNAITLRLEAYLAEHGSRLLPAPATAVPVPRTPSRRRMRELVEGYAHAKSRADVDGALALCDESFIIDTVAFGVASRDRAETALHLRVFFDAFPDYSVTVGDMAFSENGVACWGTARMTLAGSSLGAPTGRRAEVPFFCWFTFAGDRLASERFFFDLATLCDGIGVSVAALRGALATLGGAASAGVVGG